jgi:hypothetical protein
MGIRKVTIHLMNLAKKIKEILPLHRRPYRGKGEFRALFSMARAAGARGYAAPFFLMVL